MGHDCIQFSGGVKLIKKGTGQNFHYFGVYALALGVGKKLILIPSQGRRGLFPLPSYYGTLLTGMYAYLVRKMLILAHPDEFEIASFIALRI